MFSAADSWELESSTAAPLLISEPQDFVLGRNADCLKLLPALDQRVSDEGKSVSRRQATLRLTADASEIILTSQSKSNRTGVRLLLVTCYLLLPAPFLLQAAVFVLLAPCPLLRAT